MKFWCDRSGAVAPVAALFAVIVIAITGFTVDIGHVMYVQRKLQRSADAAALAGATLVVANPSGATALAGTYSARPGAHNVFSGTPVTSNAVLKCYSSVTFPACTSGSGTYNAIQVTQSTQVPMWFLQVVGFSNMTVTAVSTASAKGGSALALDVMIVLDTTASMNSADHNCSGGNKRIECAKYGVIQILNALNPQKDRVGLMVYPGFGQWTTARSMSTCPTPQLKAGDLSDYAPHAAGSPPFYSVIYDASGGASLSDTYKTDPGDTTLDATSNIVIAAGGANCGKDGVQALGGKETYFAQAITAAQAALSGSGNNSQKVIVLLSDGDAQSNHISASLKDNQCQQAVAAARAAAGSGTWVYSIAYGASTSGGSSGSCKKDASNYPGVNMRNLSACQEMAAIASEPDKFYSDNADGCSAGPGHTDSNLNNLFGEIVMSLTRPRLIPNNST